MTKPKTIEEAIEEYAPPEHEDARWGFAAGANFMKERILELLKSTHNITTELYQASYWAEWIERKLKDES